MYVMPVSMNDTQEYWTVHMQRATGITFKNLGFLQMVEKCTKWLYWISFSMTM